jgi:hypothetical protein
MNAEVSDRFQGNSQMIWKQTEHYETRGMYVYSRGGPHTTLAPPPSLIYCA